jgi:hypothetical protein
MRVLDDRMSRYVLWNCESRLTPLRRAPRQTAKRPTVSENNTTSGKPKRKLQTLLGIGRWVVFRPVDLLISLFWDHLGKFQRSSGCIGLEISLIQVYFGFYKHNKYMSGPSWFCNSKGPLPDQPNFSFSGSRKSSLVVSAIQLLVFHLSSALYIKERKE